MQDIALTHTLLGVVCGLIISAAAIRARGIALVALLIATAWIIYTLMDGGVLELERRVAVLIATLKKHSDFVRGAVIGKGVFVLLAAGFYAGRRSRGA